MTFKSLFKFSAGILQIHTAIAKAKQPVCCKYHIQKKAILTDSQSSLLTLNLIHEKHSANICTLCYVAYIFVWKIHLLNHV